MTVVCLTDAPLTDQLTFHAGVAARAVARRRAVAMDIALALVPDHRPDRICDGDSTKGGRRERLIYIY